MHVPGPENYAAEGFWNHNTGKTKAGANWALEMALSKAGIYVGVCAPTFEAVRGVCLEGESGIIAEAQRNNIEIRSYNKNRQELELFNGAKIVGASAEKPDSIRGYNFAYVWFDELAMIRYFSFYHEALQPAMRKGVNPRLLITTTPKRVRLIRDLIEKSRWEFADAEGGEGTGVHLTEAISAENIHFSRRQRLKLEKDYAGNPVMLAQELRGEMLAEVDGALFPIDQFNETRVYPGKDSLPQWRRVVVAIDPATTSKDSSDETGIVVAAEGDDGDFYILEDCSGRFSPDQQMIHVAEAYYRNSADCVVGEVNMTGDYMRALLNTVDPNIPLRSVHGMRGKVSRAQGPSSLFMQGRMHMVGDNFRLLEDQLSAMSEGDDRSRMHDDRADAAIWSILHLAGSNQGNWGTVYGFDDCLGCGARVNFDKDQRCANCGREVTRPVPKHAGGMPARVPWSDAYLKTCPDGHKYTPRERSCPKCAPSPENYLARALAASGGSGGRYGYTGKNWLAGRRFLVCGVRPYLLLDVDFVLNPDFRATWDTPEGNKLRAAGWAVLGNFSMNGRPVWLNLNHGRDLLRTAYETGAELAWATNWHQMANQVVCQVLGLPQLPLATSPPRPKEEAVIEWTAGRPFVWLDDDESGNVMPACQQAPNGAGVKVNPQTGLAAANLQQAANLLSLAASRETVPCP